ncbi:unnamed protein product [Haemonchus placei]|uniref:Uncharacterized protein n=1 Tax=Haemonchus placei TaxID=6290 RepID=A0A0N4X4U6_HAEPC|nr:unnamed protein product [Haemonchus placei]
MSIIMCAQAFEEFNLPTNEYLQFSGKDPNLLDMGLCMNSQKHLSIPLSDGSIHFDMNGCNVLLEALHYSSVLLIFDSAHEQNRPVDEVGQKEYGPDMTEII